MHSSGLGCGKWPSVAPVGGGVPPSPEPPYVVFSSSQASIGDIVPGSVAWLPAQAADYGDPDILPHAGKNLRIRTRAEFYPAGFVSAYKWHFGIFDGGVERQSYSIWDTSTYQSVFSFTMDAYLLPADPRIFLFNGRFVVDTQIIGEAPVAADLDSGGFLPPAYTTKVDNTLSSFSLVTDAVFRIGLYTPGGTTPGQFFVRNTVIEVFS